MLHPDAAKFVVRPATMFYVQICCFVCQLTLLHLTVCVLRYRQHTLAASNMQLQCLNVL